MDFHHTAKKSGQPVGFELLVTCPEHSRCCEQAFRVCGAMAFRSHDLQPRVIWLRKTSIRITFYIMQPFNEAIGNKRSILRSDDSIIQNVKNSRALEVL